MTTQPVGWIQECSILEGMFLLNTIPLGTHKTFSDYANVLMLRFILTVFQREYRSKCHVRHPWASRTHTKVFWATKAWCNSETSSTTLLSYHSNRHKNPKRKVARQVHQLSWMQAKPCPIFRELFMYNIQAYLKSHETIYIAGAFDDEAIDCTWYVHGQNRAQPDPS